MTWQGGKFAGLDEDAARGMSDKVSSVLATAIRQPIWYSRESKIQKP
jgi:hypothetical protein